uniref:AlNc14C77G5139 protein n=1 Tax=Albugo laibachii Nc14 TaxID=890382 RepID=F0WET9_9STRA|nr:AlNc14C77G5139 [Albugo laibachii Nc14]|eukprot:CCA19721.1 AlNc14C77G5139 [Albugo laibachii Nc14]
MGTCSSTERLRHLSQKMKSAKEYLLRAVERYSEALDGFLLRLYFYSKTVELHKQRRSNKKWYRDFIALYSLPSKRGDNTGRWQFFGEVESLGCGRTLLSFFMGRL